MNCDYYLPANLLFGRGRVTELGCVASRYGKKALIVTGKTSTKRSGLLERAISLLKAEGIESVVFDQVAQNPLTTTALEGACLAKSEQCQMVIGIGGGSIMDCAKAIAFLAVNDGDVSDYIWGRRIGREALDLILVPTTCGTGSEGNSFAVLTNKESGDKKSLRSNAIIAKASIVDSELMETMPSELLASVGFDAFCHCMEAYVSRIAQPITDALCVKGMQLIANSLVRLYNGERENASLWDQLSMASTIGGMVIHTAGVVLPHAMEHPVSGKKDVVHGKGLAALTPVIIHASYKAAPEKYATISKILGGHTEVECATKVQSLLDSLKLTTTLSKLGIKSKDIPWLSENCFHVSEVSIKNHPVLFNKDEIYKIYYEAL